MLALAPSICKSAAVEVPGKSNKLRKPVAVNPLIVPPEAFLTCTAKPPVEEIAVRLLIVGLLFAPSDSMIVEKFSIVLVT